MAILFFVSAAAAQTAAPAVPEFRSDGCSWFPDGDYGDCCVEHDRAYFAGGSWKQRWKADKQLFKCVARKGNAHHHFVAPVIWLGVRVGGVPWINTPFRWGFGQKASAKIDLKQKRHNRQ